MTSTTGSIDSASLASAAYSIKSGWKGLRTSLTAEQSRLVPLVDQDIESEKERRVKNNRAVVSEHRARKEWITDGMSNSEKAEVDERRATGEYCSQDGCCLRAQISYGHYQ